VSDVAGLVRAHIVWHANPFRGDKLEAGLLPLAEAALDFGALSWALYRTVEGGLDFMQQATFERKADFDRYWYSAEVGEQRAKLAGWFQVPLLPTFHRVTGEGYAVEQPAASSG
jgi:hypothetical protein